MTEEAAEEWLPPGWTAEIRVRKSGRKDRHYFDPEGHKFNSKPEVLRYLKSIESISEGKRRSSRNRPALDLSAVAEQVNIADSKTNGKKIDNQSLMRTDTLQDEKMIESCAGEKETSVLDQKEKKQSSNCEPNWTIVPNAPSQNMPEVEKTGNTKSKNNNKKPELPRRASKRLAGVEAGPVPELSPINRTRRVSARQVDDKDAATAKSSLDNTKSTLAEDNKHDLSSEDSSMPKDPNFQVEINKEKIDDVAGEVPLPDIWKDPCIEFAIKTLTGQIPIEEVLGKDKTPTKVPEPSKELPSGDWWGDPCIDFAVKTLTSDIPVPNFNIQNYFQNRDKGSDSGLVSGSVSNSNSSLTSGFPRNGNISFPKAGV